MGYFSPATSDGQSGDRADGAASPGRGRGSLLGLLRRLSGRARSPDHGARPRDHSYQRERYLRRLGISRHGAAVRGGRAPLPPKCGRSPAAEEAKGFEVESVGSGSVIIDLEQNEDYAVQHEGFIAKSFPRKDCIVQEDDFIVASSPMKAGRPAADDGSGEAACVYGAGAALRSGAASDRARVKYLQRLSHEMVWIPRVQRPPSHQTVIIFDWDDTLLCTSFLCWWHKSQTPLPEGDVWQLQAIEKAVAKLLKMAQSMGQTFIITNAETGWVESSAKMWAPSLVPLLETVQVISARSRYQAAHPFDVWMWKAEMFLEVRRRLNSQVVTNLVSIGDSEYEMDATRAMGKEFKQASIKLVKFTERPDPDELLKELEVVTNGFDRIVGETRSFRVGMERPPADGERTSSTSSTRSTRSTSSTSSRP